MDTVSSIYTSPDYKYTDNETRQMWKYGVANNVSGTPTYFVNGALLTTPPATVDEWMTLLNNVYDSQVKVEDSAMALTASILILSSLLY